jgi:hypothetical protein
LSSKPVRERVWLPPSSLSFSLAWLALLSRRWTL